MRRRPSVLSYAPGAAAAAAEALGIDLSALRPTTRKLFERANEGAPLKRDEAARFEKALLSAALGAARLDHRAGPYQQAKRRIRSHLEARAWRL